MHHVHSINTSARACTSAHAYTSVHTCTSVQARTSVHACTSAHAYTAVDACTVPIVLNLSLLSGDDGVSRPVRWLSYSQAPIKPTHLTYSRTHPYFFFLIILLLHVPFFLLINFKSLSLSCIHPTIKTILLFHIPLLINHPSYHQNHLIISLIHFPRVSIRLSYPCSQHVSPLPYSAEVMAITSWSMTHGRGGPVAFYNN